MNARNLGLSQADAAYIAEISPEPGNVLMPEPIVPIAVPCANHSQLETR